jgi:spermidine/putrescine transport system permease protein
MKRKLHPVTIAAALLALLLMLAPLAVTVVYSFNSARTGLTWEGFSAKWYAALFSDEAVEGRPLFSRREVIDAVTNSLIVAGVSTLIATVLGVMLALALERYPRSKRGGMVLDTLVDLPVVTPDILFAGALVIAFLVLRQWSDLFLPGRLTMIVGHAVFEVSFVTLVVRSRLAVMGRTLGEAAHDLYATPWQAFRKVTLPLILPAVAAGAALAFTLSLDDVVISFFTSGPQSTTLPIYIYSSMRQGLKPHIYAVSTLIIVVTMVLVMLMRLTAPRPRA